MRVEYVTNHNSTSHRFPQLRLLNLASCNLSNFPGFIKHSHMLGHLDLSNNGIGGEIPSWIRGLTQLSILDLSKNGIGGV
ncbi:hypothetical protein, partial [Pleomorphochaeta sp. DL1XJH-081]|uniref:hypothetical protein n=1 Tax=Pleomorphochaeta sp. DL1XJH-081 TaxID=3409690 RepID=UPI003BB69B38